MSSLCRNSVQATPLKVRGGREALLNVIIKGTGGRTSKPFYLVLYAVRNNRSGTLCLYKITIPPIHTEQQEETYLSTCATDNLSFQHKG